MISGDKGTSFFDIDMTTEAWNELSQGEQQEILANFGLEGCNVWGVTE
ncbi:hypothetical protein [Cohnella kolymensis]|nr:hypothetical protein [Cohnella kolymensis]